MRRRCRRRRRAAWPTCWPCTTPTCARCTTSTGGSRYCPASALHVVLPCGRAAESALLKALGMAHTPLVATPVQQAAVAAPAAQQAPPGLHTCHLPGGLYMQAWPQCLLLLPPCPPPPPCSTHWARAYGSQRPSLTALALAHPPYIITHTQTCHTLPPCSHSHWFRTMPGGSTPSIAPSSTPPWLAQPFSSPSFTLASHAGVGDAGGHAAHHGHHSPGPGGRAAGPVTQAAHRPGGLPHAGGVQDEEGARVLASGVKLGVGRSAVPLLPWRPSACKRGAGVGRHHNSGCCELREPYQTCTAPAAAHA